MKKSRIFVAAAALTLVTAGVFATGQRFAGIDLYADVSVVRTQIDNASSFPGLTTTGSQQAQIVSSSTSTPYNLYTSTNGTTFTAVYTNGF